MTVLAGWLMALAIGLPSDSGADVEALVDKKPQLLKAVGPSWRYFFDLPPGDYKIVVRGRVETDGSVHDVQVDQVWPYLLRAEHELAVRIGPASLWRAKS